MVTNGLLQEASPAKTSQSQERERESEVRGLVFGLSIGDLLTIYDRESQSWKMSECLFTGDFATYLEALPKSGMMRNGKIYEQRMWVRRTEGSESGLWLTPSTVDIGERSEKSMENRFAYRKKIGRNGVSAGCLSEQIAWSKGGNPVTYMSREKWPTPRAYEGGAYRDMNGNKKISGLKVAVQIFPTPTTRDYKGGRCPETLELSGRTENNSLNDKVNSMEGITGQLNPNWVDWLMGYPIGWTDLKDLETRLFLK